MIDNQAHKLCALKTRISQYRGEYTRDDQSIKRERILCLMSSGVMRHIRDKLYETLNTNCYEKNWLAVKRFILD